MPGFCRTELTFDEVVYDPAPIVPQIGFNRFQNSRWLQRKDATIRKISLYDWATLFRDRDSAVGIAVVKVDFEKSRAGSACGEQRPAWDLYNVPLFLTESEPHNQSDPLVVICGAGFRGYVYDATPTGAFAGALLGAVKEGQTLRSLRGYFKFDPIGSGISDQDVQVVRIEDTDTTNTVITVDSSRVIKVYRRLQEGKSPEIEISRGLNQVGFTGIPNPMGYGVYQTLQGITCPAFFIQEFVENQGDAWNLLCDDAKRSIRRRLTQSLSRANNESGTDDNEAGFSSLAGCLGEITAGLHRALSEVQDDAFYPEALSPEDVASLVESIISSIPETIEELSKPGLNLRGLIPPSGVCDAFMQDESVVGCLKKVQEIVTGIGELGMKTRIHGDLHLGQFLKTSDKASGPFVIIDFEGEPLRPVCERREKQSPLRDVAGMMRSFEYSGYWAASGVDDPPGHKGHVMELARQWGRRREDEFLKGYLDAIGKSCAFLIPRNRHSLQLLLLCFRLEKALYEVKYELRTRPSRTGIALRGVVDTITEIRSILDC